MLILSHTVYPSVSPNLPLPPFPEQWKPTHSEKGFIAGNDN